MITNRRSSRCSNLRQRHSRLR